MEMRKDLRLIVPGYLSKARLRDVLKDAPPGPVYAIYITRKGFYGDLTKRIDERAKEAYAIYADGAPILKIMRIDDAERDSF